MVKAAFTAKLWRYKGAGGWHFVDVPEKHAPSPTHAWGRTPVVAVVDGHEWNTSVWRATKQKRSVLAIPKVARGKKKHGDRVKVVLTFSL